MRNRPGAEPPGHSRYIFRGCQALTGDGEMKMKNSRTKYAKTALALLLSVCMLAGVTAFDDSVYAGNFSYKGPFRSTNYTINGRFSDNLIVNGIDVSAWQSDKSDWVAAKAGGTDFAILRVTYTNYGPSTLKLNHDGDFATFYNRAKAAGVMTGVYVFSQATSTSEAVQEADFAVRRLQALGIGPKDLNLPVYMDYEFSGGILGRMHGISKITATNSAVAFCNRIKSYGYTPGIYANLSFCNNQLDLSRFAPDVDIWCAQYNTSCGLGQNYSKWQYASNGSVSGFSGNIDVNFWFLNRKPASNPLTTIKVKKTGQTGAYPSFSIYEGDTLLIAGKDYNIGYVQNDARGQGAYVYVKGIGKYGGYALIPSNAASNLTGDEEDVDVNSRCANYLTYASTAQSSYLYVNSGVKATKIKSLKKRKKGFYIKVAKKKKANASGYQVRYSRSRDMSGATIKTIGKKYNKVSKTIKTGVRKKYFYVQVRTYKDAGGFRDYSAWSSIKRVKTK